VVPMPKPPGVGVALTPGYAGREVFAGSTAPA
jgi:hypothetical protein